MGMVAARFVNLKIWLLPAFLYQSFLEGFKILGRSIGANKTNKGDLMRLLRNVVIMMWEGALHTHVPTIILLGALVLMTNKRA